MALTVNSQNFEEKVLKSELPVVIDVFATWCGPCQQVAPIFDELAKELEGTYTLVKINIDEERDLAIKYNVSSIPTFLFINKGEVVGKEMGYMSKEDLKAKIEEMTKGMFADRVIVPTGALKAMHQALEISGRRSVIVFFGLPGAEDKIEVPALDTIFWDKTIRFSWLAPFTWPSALQALSAGLVDVKPLMSHTFELAELVDGLRRVKEREGNVMKPVVKP